MSNDIAITSQPGATVGTAAAIFSPEGMNQLVRFAELIEILRHVGRSAGHAPGFPVCGFGGVLGGRGGFLIRFGFLAVGVGIVAHTLRIFGQGALFQFQRRFLVRHGR